MEENYNELEKEKIKIEKEIENLQKELESQQENQTIIDDTENQVDSIKNEKKQKIKIKIPALKHKLNLYKRIFSIEWDQNEKKNGILSGLIGNSINGKFREFKFNMNEISQFDLTNEMWKLSEDEIKNEINDLHEIINMTQ